MIKKIFTFLLDFFFPSVCFGCNRGVKEGRCICKDCLEEIERVNMKLCVKCGCSVKKCRCKDEVFYFKEAVAPFINVGIAQRGMYKLKFGNQKHLTNFYADEMIEFYNKYYKDKKISYITAVPSNFIDKNNRGFNQAEELAKTISARIGITYKGDILKRKFISFKQHKRKNIGERFKNAYYNYYAVGKIRGNVLLVDDIFTSGASVDSCARQLLYAGADEVYCLCALTSDKNC